MKDLYYILGTDRNCTSGELNAAYQKLARKLQPDGQEHDHFLEDHLTEITEAYQTLSDPDSRRKYDIAIKKQEQRRLYYFKIKYVNVAATLALLLFTGLFGWYVTRMLTGSEKKQVKDTTQILTPAAASKIVLRHKKKHSENTAAIARRGALSKDTLIRSARSSEDKLPAVQNDQRQPDLAYLQSNVTGVIYLHELANYISPVLAKIPNRSQVTVLEKGQEFYKVSFNDQTGFVPKWTIANP